MIDNTVDLRSERRPNSSQISSLIDFHLGAPDALVDIVFERSDKFNG
jgi:hypothetical protein